MLRVSFLSRVFGNDETIARVFGNDKTIIVIRNVASVIPFESIWKRRNYKCYSLCYEYYCQREYLETKKL